MTKEPRKVLSTDLEIISWFIFLKVESDSYPEKGFDIRA